MSVFTALALVNVVALWSGVRIARGHGRAWVGLGAAFFLGVVDRAWLHAVHAAEAWAAGGASLLVAGATADPGPTLDPETRIARTSSCYASPEEVWFRDTTLRLLHRHVGPASGTWQGPVPAGRAAAAALDGGVDLVVTRDPVRGVLRGRAVTFAATPGGACADGAHLRLRVAALPDLRAVGRPDAAALLVGCGAEAAVWVEVEGGVLRPWAAVDLGR